MLSNFIPDVTVKGDIWKIQPIRFGVFFVFFFAMYKTSSELLITPTVESLCVLLSSFFFAGQDGLQLC